MIPWGLMTRVHSPAGCSLLSSAGTRVTTSRRTVSGGFGSEHRHFNRDIEGYREYTDVDSWASDVQLEPVVDNSAKGLPESSPAGKAASTMSVVPSGNCSADSVGTEEFEFTSAEQ